MSRKDLAYLVCVLECPAECLVVDVSQAAAKGLELKSNIHRLRPRRPQLLRPSSWEALLVRQFVGIGN